MTKNDIEKAVNDAKAWLDRTNEQRAYEGTSMTESRANEMAQAVLDLASLVAAFVEEQESR